MYEVEVKLRADHDRLRERLDDRAVHEVTVDQADTYYDAPHRAFGETDEALRIRRETPADGEEAARITYKGPLVDGDSKTRAEFETGVDDGETMGAVLDRLGFTPVATVEKRRRVYSLDGYTVVLDEVTDLGQFVEIERECAEGAVEATREGVFERCRDLGLDPDDQLRTSYLELLLGDN
ncbi:class IV adenylate cyclase [Halomarina ordinaria]|uniref:Class IV adenylate cyclase n=1 Tax=Halomarina ordinaria TaxID=3033939 RepID=A0ABD5U9Y9_9EURY|nr:class IV adenylate cyclase [Halomarina sp. PSRA2]